MDNSSESRRVVVVDTETTGLSGSSRIVEIAAIEVDPWSGRPGRRVHHFLDPGVSIPPAATRIHGLTDADVAGQPSFEDVAEELARFLRGATIAAQNAAFDRRMLDAELVRAKRPALDALGVRVIDTVAVSRALFPLLPRHTLDHICDHLGVNRGARRRHGALVDAQLLANALPHFAMTYEAWRASCEDVCAAAVERFHRDVRLLHQELSSETDTHRPDQAERAFARIAVASSWAYRNEESLLHSVGERVSADGWCCKRFAAKWLPTQSIAWKEAALAYLGEKPLAEFRSAIRYSMVSAGTAGQPALETRLARLAERLTVLMEDAPLPTIAATAVALRDVRKALERLRAQLREDVLRHASEGYRLRDARLTEVSTSRIDYRAALQTLLPSADLQPFTTAGQRCTVHARDLGSCALLFSFSPGPAKGRETPQAA